MNTIPHNYQLEVSGAIRAVSSLGYSRNPSFQVELQPLDTWQHLQSVSVDPTWRSQLPGSLGFHLVSPTSAYVSIDVKSDLSYSQTSNSTTPGNHASEDQFLYFISHCCHSFKEKRKLCGLVWFFGVLMLGLSQPFTSRDLFRTVADLIS